MSITKTERAEYALFMHALADKADEIARHYFDSSVGYELKADASPVTVADKEIEMELVQQIRALYPEHGIFGEESGRVNADAPLQWVIDPIDGTKAFIAGKPTFTTLIALCQNNEPTLGLISQAIKRKRWLGGDAHAEENETFIPLEEAHIATTSMGYFSAAETQAFQLLESATSTTLLNHDGLAAGLLADGSIDILLEAKLKPYDFAALVPVIEQAGGIITDWSGQPLNLNSDGRILAAANKKLHTQVLELLHSAI